MKKSGCTCGQLLIGLIILVVYVLIAFLLGYRHRWRTRQITCASNMKQLSLGFMQYAQDNDDNLPNIADAKDAKITWRVMIYPYCKSTGMYHCPSHDAKFIDQSQKYDTPDGLPSSYAANYTGDYSGSKVDKGNGAFAGRGSKPVNVKDIPNPNALIMLCEVSHHSTPDFNIDNLGAFNPGTDMLWAGHNSESVYLFADGHAKPLQPLATQGYWHRDSSIPLSAGSMKILQKAGERGGK